MDKIDNPIYENNKSLLKNILQNDIEKLIKDKWTFLNNNYTLLADTKYHRTELKEIKHVKKIKENIKNKLGYIGPFAFITDFCSKISLPGPYNNMEKVLMCIHYLISGYSIEEMEEYLKPSSFYKFYAKIFIKNKYELESWIDNMNENYFSTKDIRLLSSYINNPQLLKHVTLMIDGHHNRISYANINVNNKELYSWKLKKPGLNTQFVIDSNDMCIYISKSLPCKDNNDDRMFINDVRIKSFLSLSDCLCFDGLYENTLKEIIEKNNANGFDIDIKNFAYPIKKQKNIYLNDDEELYNNQLSGYRSGIESYFAELGRTFERFNAKKNVRITDSDIYNIQLKLACLFLNFKKMEILSNIKLSNIHKKWLNDGMNYDSKNLVVPTTETAIYKLNNILDMNNFQMNTLNKIIYNYENNIIENDIEMTNNNENMIIEENNDDYYVVDYIIKDRLINNIREFYVKWKGYKKKDNSWVKEYDFSDNAIISKYLSTK